MGEAETCCGAEGRCLEEGSLKLSISNAKTVLVTGATGFIASWVQLLLAEQGHRVIGTSRYDFRPESRFVLGDAVPPLERADVRDVGSLRPVFERHRPDVVIHLDAYVNPVALQDDPLRALEYNFLETVNALELCRDFDAERMVFASSVAVLPTICYEPIDAAHPIITATEGPGGGFYGASKAAAEIVGMTYAQAFGLDFRVVRPSAVYGFGMQWPIGIKPVIEGLARGEAVQVAGDAPKRDYTPVQDVAAIFAACVDAASDTDRVFYAGTGRALTTSADLLAEVRTAFPDGEVTMSDETLDPTGIESRYRGVLDMEPVRTQLGVETAFDSLADGMLDYAERYRRFLASPLSG